MKAEEVRKLFIEARAQTSAGVAELTFLVEQESEWVFLVKGPESEELAFQVGSDSKRSSEEVRNEIRSHLMRLF